MASPNDERTAHARQRTYIDTLERLLAIQATAVKPALDEASDILSEALGTDKIDAMLYEPATATLVAVGTSDTPTGRKQRAIGLDRQPIANGGRAVEVFHTGEIYHHGQVDADQDELLGIRQELGIRSEVIVPLDVGGERRGVLAAASTRPDAFGDDDRTFLQAVAHWLGLITQRAELVERTVQEATEAARILAADDLITVLAHDLGGYLTPVVGEVYLLRTRAARDHRHMDVASTERLTRLLDRIRYFVHDLTDSRRIDQGLFTITPHPVDLVRLAHDVVEALRTATTDLQIQAPPELLVPGDGDRLAQAVSNLVTNALKHTPEGTPIVIEVAQEVRAAGPWAVLSVRDRGPGIPPEAQARLFQRFVRGQRSKGLGLGLYLARGIAEAHGGTLTVASQPGQGATFQIALPSTQAAAAAYAQRGVNDTAARQDRPSFARGTADLRDERQ